MKVKQISVFLENRSGKLFDVLDLLGKNNINIRALSIADSADFGILRLIVNLPEKALEILKAAGFTTSISNVIAIEVEDKPGGLANVLRSFKENSLNVEYMYAFVGTVQNEAIVIFKVDEIDKAIEMLQKEDIKLLDNEEVLKL